MRPRIILVDISNTLADFNGRLHEIYCSRHPNGPIIPKEELKEYHLADDYRKRISQKAGDDVFNIYHEKGFFSGLNPIPYAITALNEMLDDGYQVYLCTSSLKQFENCVNEKYQWILEHMGRKWTDRIIVSSDKTLVRGDILIDDAKPELAKLSQLFLGQ